MSKKYFGTDGIRGKVNQENINGEMFFKFGLAAGTYFKNQKKSKQIAIIAKDTRLSGYTLEPALVSGLASAGVHVFTFGPLPTNGLAMLTKKMRANMGIMITASHNPYYDNGLKLFGPDGLKLSDKIEKKIEKIIDSKITDKLSNPKILGRVKRLEDGPKKYIEILKNNFPNQFNLRGLKIAIDCANGAAYKAGPQLLRSLGAKVYEIGTSPNGFNINEKCGSTFPNKIKNLTKKNRAHIGISLDGDADRIIICDEKGNIIDGDKIIAMLAQRWNRKKILKTNFPKQFNLRGLKIAIDCANGAAYKVGPKLLRSLGAVVYEIGTSPNGFNINNKCGSTFPNKIRNLTKKNRAHIGISLDGDADRIIICDERGTIIDGDKIIAMLATRWKSKKILKGG